jgi:hypothetical protein
LSGAQRIGEAGAGLRGLAAVAAAAAAGNATDSAATRFRCAPPSLAAAAGRGRFLAGERWAACVESASKAREEAWARGDRFARPAESAIARIVRARWSSLVRRQARPHPPPSQNMSARRRRGVRFSSEEEAPAAAAPADAPAEPQAPPQGTAADPDTEPLTPSKKRARLLSPEVRPVPPVPPMSPPSAPLPSPPRLRQRAPTGVRPIACRPAPPPSPPRLRQRTPTGIRPIPVKPAAAAAAAAARADDASEDAERPAKRAAPAKEGGDTRDSAAETEGRIKFSEVSVIRFTRQRSLMRVPTSGGPDSILSLGKFQDKEVRTVLHG